MQQVSIMILKLRHLRHDVALEKARAEYAKYQNQLIATPLTFVENHFLKAIQEIEQISSD